MMPSVFLLLFVAVSIVSPSFANTTLKKYNIAFKVEDGSASIRAKQDCSNTNVSPIVKLLNFVVRRYLTGCSLVMLYNESLFESIAFQAVIIQFLRTFSEPIIHGQFSTSAQSLALFPPVGTHCFHYIVLSQTLNPVTDLLGYQPHSRVVLVPQASQWQINNFLESPSSDQLVNLLVVTDPSLQLAFFHEKEHLNEDINLYTHKLYSDPMGMRTPHLLTAWRCDRLTRPHIDLFPPKATNLNGYQLRIVASEQPPYVYQKYHLDEDGEAVSQWDGLEVRLLKLISKELNFTYKFQLPTTSSWENSAASVLTDVARHKGDVAVAGIPVTTDRVQHFKPSITHSHDCAVFMTLASTALPKYRAIMGPFRWEVWMTITLAYLFAILPISFSAHHTLRPLLNNPWELENMFWYVFGTFTNCFTFKKSWISGKMFATRIFIGSYWLFSIIVSAAYTGSIIAFIMLPRFPEVIETPRQLIEDDFKLIITNKSDLKQSIYNTTDAAILQLSHNLKIVPTVDDAVSNVTKSRFFTHYAFLHSREFLKHIIRTNLTKLTSHKKSAYHLSKTCFVPILVAMMFPPQSVLVNRIDMMLMRASQGGFIQKLVSDVAWDQQRSDTGKLLQVSGGGVKSSTPEERQLTLDDTQGMFLLMGAGFGLAVIAFATECCFYIYRKHRSDSWSQLPSITCSAYEVSSDSRNFQFRSKDEFLQYLSSGSPHGDGQMEATAQVHKEASPLPPKATQSVRSLTAILGKQCNVRGSHHSA